MDLHWLGSTRYHDWRASQRATPRRLLAGLQEACLIGPVEWFAASPSNRRRVAKRSAGTLGALLDHEPPTRSSHGFDAGGSIPAPWELGMLLAPYDEDDSQVRGYNILNLRFSSATFGGVKGSEAIVHAFRALHTSAETEVAYIHPRAHFVELSDPLSGAYGVPLTFGPMFRGVVWANYLGPRHLELFDLDRLRKVEAYQVEWTADGGLFLQATADVSEASSPSVERELVRLTEQFRSALR